jgi:hypothetical protein
MIHLTILVANPAELLDPEAYDAGALLRWEWCATVDGTYAEDGTVALVADQFLYEVWDETGTSATWYRTRVSDSGAALFSPYSTPFQAASAQLYLTLDQFRAFEPEATLSDESLLILLQASATDIVREIGPTGDVEELLHASGPLLMLSRPAAGIVSVVEDAYGAALALTASDYELSATGRMLRRLDDGTNPSGYWCRWARVTYAPFDDLAVRQRAQLALVRLDIANTPGLAAQTIGTWSEQYASNSAWNYQEERKMFLAGLSGDEVVVF